MGLIKNYTNQFYHGERIISSTTDNVMESIDDNKLFGVEEEDDCNDPKFTKTFITNLVKTRVIFFF